MARRLPNGYLELSDGRVLAPNSLIILHDIPELVHAHSFGGFVSGGGGAGRAGEPGKQGATGVPGLPGGPTGMQGTTGVAGPTGAQGVTGIGAGVGATGIQLVPARTLFVSPSWPAGADPLVFFTTISAALTRAAALSPTEPSPVSIIVYNGTYTESLTLISNVKIGGLPFGAVNLVGSMTWTPGAGPNAGQAALPEIVSIENIQVDGGLTVGATAKTGSVSVLNFNFVDFTVGAAMTLTGRGTGADDMRYNNGSAFVDVTCTDYEARFHNVGVVGSAHTVTVSAGTSLVQLDGNVSFGFWTVTGSGASLDAQNHDLVTGFDVLAGARADIENGVTFGANTFSGAGTVVDAIEYVFVGTTTVNDGAFVNLSGGESFAAWTVGTSVGCTVDALGHDFIALVTNGFSSSTTALSSRLLAGITNLAGSVDIRTSEFFSTGLLTGPGAIQRSLQVITLIGPSVVGSNLVPLVPPFPDAGYNVMMIETAVAGGAPTIAISSKLPGSFTYEDTVGLRGFDATITHE